VSGDVATGLKHRAEIQVRWGDQDAYQHVNNVAYAAYLQEARAEMLAAAGVRASAHARHGTFVVARLKVQYLRQLTFRPAPVTVTTWVSAISPARITLRCEITEPEDDGLGPYVRGLTVLVPYDLDKDFPRRVSDEERAALTHFLIPDET
jgi:acyl-CoA thioester hydrolase